MMVPYAYLFAAPWHYKKKISTEDATKTIITQQEGGETVCQLNAKTGHFNALLFSTIFVSIKQALY